MASAVVACLLSMKTIFAVFLLAGVLASFAADPQTPVAPSNPKEDYNQFLAQSVTRENLVDCITVMDRLVDEGEHGVVDKEPDPGMVEATTKSGLHCEFSTTDIKEAIIYYLKISRNGKDLKYSDAVKFAALFTDRAGLPHPIDMSEGDKSTFIVQWLIKPSQWKSMHKMMIKVRAQNRAEKDPMKALIVAIEREMDARAAVQQGH